MPPEETSSSTLANAAVGDSFRSRDHRDLLRQAFAFLGADVTTAVTAEEAMRSVTTAAASVSFVPGDGRGLNGAALAPASCGHANRAGRATL
jgi:hypothetical protein